MKAGRLNVSTLEFAIKELPTPSAGRDEVRIKVAAAGVCLSDVHFLDGTLKAGYLESAEVTLGHEVAGSIDQIGSGVTELQIGDRVIVIAGERNERGQITTLGFDYDGGYAEYVIARSSLVVKIPSNLPFEQAAIIPDAVSTPWAAITATAKVKEGETAAVFGVGGLGIHAVQLLKLVGCSKVIAIDPRADARERALEVGADIALDPSDDSLRKHRGLNVAFDFAGVTPVRKQALSLLGELGRLVIVGIANEPITIPNDMAFTYLRTAVLGHYGSEPEHTRELVDLIAQGKLDLSRSVTEVLPLTDAGIALERLAKKVGNPIRIVLQP
jgi:D-arabinose 1-dehydrogenase-like Zn-dependent alcohol dehydrogenase